MILYKYRIRPISVTATAPNRPLTVLNVRHLFLILSVYFSKFEITMCNEIA